MGYGDQLVAAGLAEIAYRANPAAGPVTITDLGGRPRWQPLWQGNPAIGVTTDGPRVTCGDGCLPYLLNPKRPGPLRYNPAYRAADSARARIYLTDSERAAARERTRDRGAFLLLEPFPQDRQNVNRQWPLAAWQELVTRLQRACPGYTLVQCQHDHATYLDGVTPIWSPTFRDACALLERATLVVALEGGIPFATAALDVSTVVLWGGAVPADVLAYPEHVNLVGSHNGCGMKKPCAACTRSWQEITPQRVVDAVITELAQIAARAPHRKTG